MSGKSKTLQTFAFFLGIICFLWIIYDFLKICNDLHAVLFSTNTGLIIGIGYLFILSFHALVLVLYFRHFRHQQEKGLSGLLLILFVFSFLALAVEKVMFDEVGREFYLEFPAPGEVHFIYLGLFLNALFVLFALYCISRFLWSSGKASDQICEHVSSNNTFSQLSYKSKSNTHYLK